jgi:hypothetical protein
MVQFTDFSSNGRATGVVADTGYAIAAINYMWTKYNDQLITAAQTFTGFATYDRATENVRKTRPKVQKHRFKSEVRKKGTGHDFYLPCAS